MTNLKVGKKFIVAITSVLSIFTFSDFVSIIGAENAGGIIVKKETMIVNTVIARIDDVNPSTIYGGTWELIDGDANLGFGDGNAQTGIVEGDNTPLVPLLKHTHTGTTSSAGSHNHTFTRPRGDENYSNGSGNSWWGSNSNTKTTNTTGNHTHTLNINDEGDSDARLDVRGARIKLNFWKRIK